MRKLARLTALLLTGALLLVLTACGAVTETEQQAKQRLLGEINSYRASIQLAPLVEVKQLSDAEQIWAEQFRAAGKTLEARICNWILELLAHTFGCLCALPAAGAVPAGALESFSDGADNLLIGIELDFHVRQLFLDCGFIIPQDKVFFCDEVTLIKKSGAF